MRMNHSGCSSCRLVHSCTDSSIFDTSKRCSQSSECTRESINVSSSTNNLPVAHRLQLQPARRLTIGEASDTVKCNLSSSRNNWRNKYTSCGPEEVTFEPSSYSSSLLSLTINRTHSTVHECDVCEQNNESEGVNSLPFYNCYINSSSSRSVPSSHHHEHVKLTRDTVSSSHSSGTWESDSETMATLVRTLPANDSPLSSMQIEAPSRKQQSHEGEEKYQRQQQQQRERQQQVLVNIDSPMTTASKSLQVSRENKCNEGSGDCRNNDGSKGMISATSPSPESVDVSPVSSTSQLEDVKRSIVIAGSTLRTIVKGLVNRKESITSSSKSKVNVHSTSSTVQGSQDSLPLTTCAQQSSGLQCQLTRNRIDREYKFDEATQTWYRESNSSCSSNNVASGRTRKHSKRQNVCQIKSSNKVDARNKCTTSSSSSRNKDDQVYHVGHSSSSNSSLSTVVKLSSNGKGVTLPSILHLAQSYSADDIDRLIQRSPSKTTVQPLSQATSSSKLKNCTISAKIKLKKAFSKQKLMETNIANEICHSDIDECNGQFVQGNKIMPHLSKRSVENCFKSRNEQVNKDINCFKGKPLHISNHGSQVRQCHLLEKEKSRIDHSPLKKCNSNFEMGTFFHSEAGESEKVDGDDDAAEVMCTHSTCSVLPMEESTWDRRRRRRRSIDLSASASQYSFAIEEEEEEEEGEEGDGEDAVEVEVEGEGEGEGERRQVEANDEGAQPNSQERIRDSCCRSERSTVVESAGELPSARGKLSESIVVAGPYISMVTSELTRRHEVGVSKKVSRVKSTAGPGRLAIHEETEGCDQEPHHQILTSRFSYPDDTFTLNSTKNSGNICSNDSFILARRHSTSTGGTSDSSSDDSHQEEAIDSSKSNPLRSTSKKNRQLKNYIPQATKAKTSKSATVHSFTSFLSSLSSSAVALAASAAPSLLTLPRAASTTSSSSSSSSPSSTSSFSSSINSLATASIGNSVLAKCAKRFASKKEGEKNFYPQSSVDALNKQLLMGRSISQSTVRSSNSLSPQSDSTKFCALCFESLPCELFHTISSCKCFYCKECLTLYLKNLIRENSVHVPFITCPDADCPKGLKSSKRESERKMPSRISSISSDTIRSTNGLKETFSFLQRRESKKNERITSSPTSNYLSFLENNSRNLISPEEIFQLVDEKTYKLYVKLKIEYEVRRDHSKTFCPMPNCDNICSVIRPTMTSGDRSTAKSLQPCNTLVSISSPTAAGRAVTTIDNLPGNDASLPSNTTDAADVFAVYCERCKVSFCFRCRSMYHPGSACTSLWQDDLSKYLLTTTNQEDGPEIKRCPRCSVWIERDDGCAQMMCRKCRFVFCWFCLKSLEDDFLLRHYDSGPCKNKLGHSRASVMWHRTQVLGIFAGFGVLLLLVAPLFLIAFPCIVCCSCCSKSKNCCKWIHEEDEFEEEESQENEEGPSFDTYFPAE